MEERMTDIKNSLTDTIDRTKIYWGGKAHTEVEDELKKLLNKGTFHTAYKKIKAVSGCLAAFLPEINALLTRCEGFAEQLQYNSCIEPHKPAEGDNTVHNDGILALNYSYVSCIAETLTEILNALLYADPQHCPKYSNYYYHGTYLDMITVELKTLADMDSVAIMVGTGGYINKQLEQLAIEGREYYNQYSLWEATCRIYNLDIQ